MIGAQPVAVIAFSDDGRVRPLAHATADVKIGGVKSALAVPAAAIALDNAGRTYVEVKQGKSFRRVAVQTGVTDGQFTAILSGLSPNEIVLAPGPKQRCRPLIAANRPLPPGLHPCPSRLPGGAGWCYGEDLCRGRARGSR